MNNKNQTSGGQNLKPELKEIYDKIMNTSTDPVQPPPQPATKQETVLSAAKSETPNPDKTPLSQLSNVSEPILLHAAAKEVPPPVPAVPVLTNIPAKTQPVHAVPPKEDIKESSSFAFSLGNEPKKPETAPNAKKSNQTVLIAVGIIIFFLIYTFVWLVGLKIIKLF